jgi:hypothetical protein
VSVEGNTFSQLNLVNVDCRNVPVLVGYAQSGKKVAGKAKMYRVKEFTYGLVYQDLNDASSFREICEIEPVAKLPVTLGKDLHGPQAVYRNIGRKQTIQLIRHKNSVQRRITVKVSYHQ